jgi:formylglycine-generating enzyme required for sulfatase activity
MVPLPQGALGLGSRTLRCTSGDCDSPPAGDPVQVWVERISWLPAAEAVIGASFSIDSHEVTNAQYRVCVERGNCTPPLDSYVGAVDYSGDQAYDNRPVVNVTQQQARVYCLSQEKRLPNEAEWEWAARYRGVGEALAEEYPWTSAKSPSCTPSSASYLASAECGEALPIDVYASSLDQTETGIVHNMAGNVAEWVEDGWNTFSYCKDGKAFEGSCASFAAPSCSECAGKSTCAQTSGCSTAVAICLPGVYTTNTANQTEWVVRGGSYLTTLCDHRLFVRRRQTVQAAPDVGFRCVK